MRRTIELEGCYNFRDLGGYPTEDGRKIAWRQLFRSDGLHHLTQRDVERLCGEIALGEIIDLRSSSELRVDGRGPLARRPVRFHHLPLFDGRRDRRRPDYDEQTATLADRYFFLAQLAQDAVRQILAVLAAASSPAVYHCAAGKDRTGVVSAILLGLLGVRDEIVIADYAASRENLDAIIDRLMATEGYQTMLEALPADTMHAEPDTMRSFLERMRDEYGSMRDYVLAAGASQQEIEALRDRLLTRGDR